MNYLYNIICAAYEFETAEDSIMLEVLSVVLWPIVAMWVKVRLELLREVVEKWVPAFTYRVFHTG